MRISDVVPLDEQVLFVETEDGTSGVFDIKPYLESEAFSPLKDYHEFCAVHNGGYFLEWSCGADLSADTVEARLRAPSPAHAQQLRNLRRLTVTRRSSAGRL